jgi:hypothetical protein
MDLKFIQDTLKEFESERYNIHNLVNKVLRIAQYRGDFDIVFYTRLFKINLLETEPKEIFKDVYRHNQDPELKELFKNTYDQVLKTRSVDLYDISTREIEKDKILVYSVSELTSQLNHVEELLKNNKLPEGLHTQDMYFAKERKDLLDSAYYNQSLGYKKILNRVRDYLIDYLIKAETEMLEKEERENLDAKQELDLLIADGNKVRSKCYVPSEGGLYDYIKGAEYIAWIERCKRFIKTHINDKETYQEFLKYATDANGNGDSHFEGMMGILTSLVGVEMGKSENTLSVKDEKIRKIFISHASKDVKYVEHLVQLLNDMGIVKSDKSIFCSSLPGYDIPYGENIYDFLKGELNNNNIMVLFVLSNNYYKSASCLNEMGAAWVTSRSQNFILLPNFNFSQISGAIDPSKISFNLNDEHGLDKFKDKIVEIFELEEIDYKIWNKDKAKFVEFINILGKEDQAIMTSNIELEKVRKVESNLEIQLRLINNTDKAVEFKFIDIELTDSSGKTAKLTLEDELEDFILYKNENKINNWSIPYEDCDLNVRRIDESKTRIKYEVS